MQSFAGTCAAEHGLQNNTRTVLSTDRLPGICGLSPELTALICCCGALPACLAESPNSVCPDSLSRFVCFMSCCRTSLRLLHQFDRLKLSVTPSEQFNELNHPFCLSLALLGLRHTSLPCPVMLRCISPAPNPLAVDDLILGHNWVC